ncbi:MAG: NAD(P)-dependent oxidoreductase [Chloroflexi bacterium]|nr:NAD(P)-dependent oxidoreductase [Chloroflexota bacterium]
MTAQAVAILSPGDMGHSVGRVLVDHGVEVLTCLEGRSDRTRALARQAGIKEVASYAELVQSVDILLSILVPARAVEAASAVAGALQAVRKSPVYVDCNAVSPETKREIGRIVAAAGGRFVDAAIIGAPPGRGRKTKFYACGPHLEDLDILVRNGLDVRRIGGEIGQAAGLKMMYAALTKGLIAISTEAFAGARQMGLYDELIAEMRDSLPGRYEEMERGIPTMVYRARRWIGEMEEIAKTFAGLGMTPAVYQGAAHVYRMVGKTPLADETPETLDRTRTLARTIDIIAAHRDRHGDG